MIKLKIKELAKARDITTAYQLQKAANLHPSHAARLWKGSIELIGLSTIDKLCAAFDCEPGDLIVRVEGKKRASKRR